MRGRRRRRAHRSRRGGGGGGHRLGSANAVSSRHGKRSTEAVRNRQIPKAENLIAKFGTRQLDRWYSNSY